MIDITKSFKEKCTSLEDKNTTFFKTSNAIAEPGGPPLVRDSMLIFSDEMEVEMSKVKDRWAREFNNLIDFFEDNIKARTMDYVNLNNNISVIICEA